MKKYFLEVSEKHQKKCNITEVQYKNTYQKKMRIRHLFLNGINGQNKKTSQDRLVNNEEGD